jgi:hypothetical protein
MKTSIKCIHSMKVTLLLRTLSACLLVVAFSFATIPSRAGDAEDKALEAMKAVEAAKQNVDDKKKELERVEAIRNGLLGDEFDSGKNKKKKKKKKTPKEEEALAIANAEVAKAQAALAEAEAALVAARLALEQAINELPDGDFKEDLKKKRNFPSLVTANGLHTVRFETPSGQLTVNLPDDMRAGDTISGTVVAEPKGQTPEARTKNQAELQGYVVSISSADSQSPKTPSVAIFDLSKGLAQPDGSTIVTATFTAPKKANVGLFSMPNQNHPIGACGRSGSIVAINESCSPISQLVFESPDQGIQMGDPPITPTFNIPTLGQTGRPLVITGPFDGNSSNTTLRTSVQDFEKNTENVSGGFGLLAESHGEAVFQSSTNVTGPIEIRLNEGNKQTTGTYRNIGVNLSAPKTSLLKGEQTPMLVLVTGAQGIKEPLPLTLESHGVITMEGGNYQQLMIQPSQVGADGRYSTTRRITGVQAGSWGATATVVTHRFDVCLQDPTREFVLVWSTFNGDYIFACPGCSPPAGPAGGSSGQPTDQAIAIKTAEFKRGLSGLARIGSTASGKGTITMKGCVFTLEHNAPDRRVMSTIDQCTHTGSASVQASPPNSPKVKFTITDRNTTDNTCSMQ